MSSMGQSIGSRQGARGLAALAWAAQPASVAQQFARAAQPVAAAPARPRTRLWELHGSVHCSVIGTCLTPAELRRVMGRVLQAGTAGSSDHDLHAEAVALCSQHTACAKLLQKALDKRHEATIKQFAKLPDEAAVLEAWRVCRQSGDIPGPYWAVLTHPDTSHAGVRQVFGDVHMLSHLIGAANRADIARLAALEAENVALLAKVGRQQLRVQEAMAARDAAARQLTALAVQPDAAAAPASEALAAIRAALEGLQALLARAEARGERQQRRAADASGAAQAWERRALAAEAECAALRRELALSDPPDTTAEPAFLPAETVLYVGGRPGCVEQVRGLLEAAGGALLVHDGGRHDHPSLLPGLVSRADHVVFPVDCVSHDAALSVKRLCRQAGKSWSPLRSSGTASFVAAMARPGAPAACCAHHGPSLLETTP